MKHKIALQLYTIRDYCKDDLLGTLRKVKEIGYDAVQFAGFYDHQPSDIKIVLDQLRLKTAGLHVSYTALFEDTASLLETAEILGTRDLILATMPKEYQDEAGYRKVKSELQALAKKLKPQGIRVSYHNHAYEFNTLIDGQDALTYLLDSHESPDLHAEVDVFWVKKGGHEIFPFISTYINRMPIIHLKDMSHEREHHDVPIGTGSIEFKSIIKWGEQSGVEWYVLEQDNCRTDSLESVALSYKNMMSILENLDKN